MSKFSTIIFIIAAAITTFSFKYAPSKKAKVNWQTTSDVSDQWAANKKPIIVDIYTDWCHYCKVMDNTTYSNDSIADYINQHFYRAKINAESKTAFQWMGKEYKYMPIYKVNQLAIDLSQGKMVYPTTVIIPSNGETQVIGGALSVQEMEMILKYFGGDNYEKMNWNDFVKGFKSSW